MTWWPAGESTLSSLQILTAARDVADPRMLPLRLVIKHRDVTAVPAPCAFSQTDQSASVFELSQQVSTIMENLNNGVPNVSGHLCPSPGTPWARMLACKGFFPSSTGTKSAASVLEVFAADCSFSISRRRTAASRKGRSFWGSPAPIRRGGAMLGTLP